MLVIEFSTRSLLAAGTVLVAGAPGLSNLKAGRGAGARALVSSF